MNTNRCSMLLVLALFAGAPPAHPAENAGAAKYPSKPVRLIIPFPPGGSNDLLSRYLAIKLTERLGEQVVVDIAAAPTASSEPTLPHKPPRTAIPADGLDVVRDECCRAGAAL